VHFEAPMSAADVSVTVVIPTYNRAARLGVLLQSLERLQPPGVPYDIVVADNGSTDETSAVIAAYAQRSTAPIRMITEQRRGVSHARNSGVAATNASIVAFCDDDQDVAPDWVKTIVDTFATYPDVAFVCGRVWPRWLHPAPAWLSPAVWGPASIIDRGDRAFRISRRQWMCLPAGNMAWRRASLIALEGFSTAFPRAEDRELTVRALLAGYEGLYVPEMVVYHHLDGARLTRRFFRQWNRIEGEMRAGYAFEELFSADGQLRPVPETTPRLLGVSRFLYRAWAEAVAGYGKALLKGDRAAAFARRNRVVYLSAYINRRIQLAGPRSRALPHGLGAVVARGVARAVVAIAGTGVM
jgi:glycosyltransferase involved in cell wall biosynthesis